ncbi:Probable RNA-directed DNA polymerase from transposon BS [Eumeta japonica]|uniref:Probable RNA-directed DNA polymerase from transposon BS n=1 Tax=Eumeta variegata TaxID=151549 RepID=A0A4C1TLE5_EUMVA|nr:Probable RNA-directed DNA polymerase from transposon BS [Eumeta japonica]
MLVRTVASFLEGRSFYVTVKDAISDPRSFRAGVPQGSCLSPCLYAVFTDDILGLGRRADDPQPIARLAEQMASRREYNKDSRLIDQPTEYYVTEVETPRTRSGMADQEPHGVCYVQFFSHTYQSEPKWPCMRATSDLGSRTQHQHGTYSAPHNRGKGSKPSKTSPYG